jgi:hypothetical protein
VTFTASHRIEISGDSLTLCDVRCGPTEDKLAVEIGRGTYSVVIRNDDESVWITICRSDVQSPEDGDELGEISIDGGVLGAYDTDLLDKVFSADAEEFYHWGDSLFEVGDEISIYHDSIKPYQFACIPTFCDGVFRLIELRHGGARVGVGLRVPLAADQEPEDFLMFQFHLNTASTCAEVWLDPVYDNEDILDCLIDSLQEVHDQDVDSGAVDRFIAAITSIDFAKQEGESLLPKQHLELSKFSPGWNSNSAAFCEFLLKVMSKNASNS